MTREQIIEDIANIQYFIKTSIYNECIGDKLQYFEKIKNTYAGIGEDELKENFEEVKYLAVGAIKLNVKERIEANCAAEKLKAYEEYIHKCKAIEMEMKNKLTKSKELESLTVDSIISYINEHR